MLSGRALLCCCTACLVLVLCFLIPETRAKDAIQLWYGEEQQFGFPGIAQPWVNIIGRISKQDQLASLSFSVNEGPEQILHIGPDSRRLSVPGDFNIEIDANALYPGKNSIHINRILKDNSRDVRHVRVDYQGRPWPLPYRVKWAEVENIQNAVQVVDGMWEMSESGIRTTSDFIGYDRALAVGDAAWSSYEILLSFSLNSVDSSAYDSPESVSPGLGLILHWNGHTNSPIDCAQPHCGWFPFGAIHWYNFPKSGPGGFSINTRPINDISVALPYVLEIGKNYLLRSQVKTFPFKTSYFLKVWPQGKTEPDEWSLQQTADRKNPDHGGFLIVAHHVDLTIGNIEVRPISVSKGVPFREYLTILPQVLSLAAGFLFLCLAGVSRKFRQNNRVVRLAFLLAATVLLITLEPLLPAVLQQFSVNAAMSTALYLGFDFSSVFLHLMIWIIIISNIFKMFCNKHPESTA